MTVALILTAAAFCAAAAAAAWLYANRTRGPQTAREVVVHTRRPDDQTVRGVLIAADRRWLRLEAARYGRPDGSGWEPMDGQVLIPAGNVSFVQDVSPDA